MLYSLMFIFLSDVIFSLSKNEDSNKDTSAQVIHNHHNVFRPYLNIVHKSIHHFYSPPIIYFGYQPISRL